MAWGAVTTSDALTLSGSYQIVQESAANMVINPSPGETMHVQLDFNPQTTPTEWCEFILETSPDETNWDVVAFDAGVLNDDTDPNLMSFLIRDVFAFRIKAKLIDTDGTAGGDDTGSTLTVRVRGNGISL